MLGYKLIGDITVASAQTSVSFTGLNITKDDDYLLTVEINNTVAADTNLTLYPNSLPSGYYQQDLSANNATVSGGRQNAPIFCTVQASSKTMHSINLKLTNSGYFVYTVSTTKAVGLSSSSLVKTACTSTFTMSSVTALTLGMSASNSIGIGSRFMLYKLTAKKVADITVGTATTQVDITGLAIDKTSEYMLVSDVVNSTASNAYYDMLVNGNNTITNYYSQRLEGAGTTVSADRQNKPFFSGVGNGFNVLSITNIKLANSGYFVFESSLAAKYATSSLYLDNIYGASTFTATSITSLRLASEVANGIGIGSRFQLYKLI